MRLAPGDCTRVCHAHRGRGAPTGHVIVVGTSTIWASTIWTSNIRILKVFGLALGALAARGTGLLVCGGVGAPAVSRACGLPVSSGTGGLPSVRAVVRGVLRVVAHPAIIGSSSASGARRGVRTTVGLRESRNSRQSRTEHESRNCQNASRGHELFSHLLLLVVVSVVCCGSPISAGCRGSSCWGSHPSGRRSFRSRKSDPQNGNTGSLFRPLLWQRPGLVRSGNFGADASRVELP
jgi:hypothetical protein